jgi:hypothetical protein
MSTIFQTKNNKIQKIGNKYKFSFENGEKFNNFYKKSWKFLNLKNIKQKNFTFNADNVMPLSKFISQNHNTLTYNQAKWLFLDIGKQYQGLEKDGFGNLYIETKDIVCIFLNNIDDRNGEKIIYLYLNTSSFVEKKNMDMELTKPIKRNKYFSPEMLSLNSFPAMLPYTSCYYSLALLIIDILSDLKNLDHTTENFEFLLQEYADTKLYYSLIRCLDEDPNNRYFLFI